MQKQDIGVVGMAVMGKNLAINISKKNYKVSIFNRTREKTDNFICKHLTPNIKPYYSIKKFINSLQIPRKILLMVKSGKSTDETINTILPYLNEGDILIDGGNAFYKDTIRRYKNLESKKINFIGAGISGGEYGALHGPSIMPGGNKNSYKIIYPILKKISAKYKNKPCVNYIGPDGSGHYVKMVHNGIEYADMQLIAETYFLLKNILGMNNKNISNIFENWNNGELNSYLIQITIDIFRKKNKKGLYLIDLILDEASNKGTGSWTSKSALDLSIPLSLITESVFSRYISSMKHHRILASKILNGPNKINYIEDKKKFIENIRRALYLSKIICYAQGFLQLQSASNYYKWNLKCGDISKIFRSGCIIRAKFLKKIADAYSNNIKVVNLLLTPYFQNIANKYQYSLRKIVSFSIKNGFPVPVFSSAISYYDSYRTRTLPANLIQAQRDYFGAHEYKRHDKHGSFHTDWSK
ncbi:NADP-dependent phosphogluconate dehydrogenase [Buchnera aphidicola (Taiwanaphis decaspermi)]|uniref:NADP-dependent phosphogluconate dehydrogenase n=1 Tax=Buchnera aphidicola TaxID=9 RepID=UPI0031B87F9D